LTHTPPCKNEKILSHTLPHSFESRENQLLSVIKNEEQRFSAGEKRFEEQGVGVG
jgi:hypothetical protein